MKLIKHLFYFVAIIVLLFSISFLFFCGILALAGIVYNAFIPIRHALENSYIQLMYMFPHAKILLGAVGTILLLIVGAQIRFALHDSALKALTNLAQLFSGNKRTMLFLFSVILIVITFLAKEYQLYKLGYCPGSYYAGNDFKEAQPKVTKRLLADSLGMAYYNPEYYPEKNDSSQFIVNADGFPSRFDYTPNVVDSLAQLSNPRRKKFLFLGDSFLEGVGASTCDKSFVELYRRNQPKKLICSTGIGGMDVVQYRLVAEKYIPLLKPDAIVIFFCGWNDVAWMERKPKPFLPLHGFVDHVGIIYNYIPTGITPYDTLTLSTDSAYRLYRSRFSLMGRKDMASQWAKQTRLSTQLYYKFNPISFYPCQFHPDSAATYRNLKRIKTLCDSNGIQLSILFIPTPLMQSYTMKEYTAQYKWVFQDLWSNVHFCPKGYFDASDCSSPTDFHFNNKGQLKMEAFMKSCL